MLISSIAIQCVIDSLIKFLNSELRSQNLVAWWYDVSCKCQDRQFDQDHADRVLHTDLHSCASTLLMTRLCIFSDSSFTDESLSASWDLCLQCLSGYTEITLIAR